MVVADDQCRHRQQYRARCVPDKLYRDYESLPYICVLCHFRDKLAFYLDFAREKSIFQPKFVLIQKFVARWNPVSHRWQNKSLTHYILERGGFPQRLRERLELLNRAEIKSPRALLVSKTRDRGMCADRPAHNRCCMGQEKVLKMTHPGYGIDRLKYYLIIISVR